jgi:hypothetical protein
MTTEDMKVVEAMERFGGSFTQALALAIRRADCSNLQKIKTTWPEEVAKYTSLADSLMEERE